MLPDGFIVLVIAMRLFGGLAYLRATARGRAHPELLSWFLWAMTPMIAFAAELSAGVGIVAYVTLALGISPLLVFLTAFIKRTGVMKVDRFNVLCVIFSIIGIVLWLTTSNPELAILLAIVADIASAVPTVRKIITSPETEYAPTYALSAAAMIIALFTIKEWDFAAYAFPLYVLTVNSFIVFLIGFQTKRQKRAKKKLARRRRSAKKRPKK